MEVSSIFQKGISLDPDEAAAISAPPTDSLCNGSTVPPQDRVYGRSDRKLDPGRAGQTLARGTKVEAWQVTTIPYALPLAKCKIWASPQDGVYGRLGKGFSTAIRSTW